MTGRRRVSSPFPAEAAATREISIANRHPRLRLSRRAIRRAIALLDSSAATIGLAERAIPRGELSLVFLPDSALAKLHAEFMDDPAVTDVITFAGNPLLATAGEICVSADTAAAYAKEHDGDFSAELTLYLVHGWLHLAGHDDLVPAKKRAMRRAEAHAMRILRRAGAVPRFAWRTRR